MFTAAGAVAAFDSRIPDSTQDGHLGGVLQATTYISAVSGGSWLISSLMMHGFKTVQELQEGPWDFAQPLLEGIPDIDLNYKKVSFKSHETASSFEKRDITHPNEYSQLNKRLIRQSLRAKIQQVLTELNNFSSDLSSYASDKLKSFFEGVKEIPLIEPIPKIETSVLDEYQYSTSCEQFDENIATEIFQNNTIFTIPLSHSQAFDSTIYTKTLKMSNNTHMSSFYNQNTLNTSNRNSFSTKTSFKLLNQSFGSPSQITQTVLVGTSTPQTTESVKEKQNNFWIKIAKFYQDLHFEVRLKKLAGFRVTFTDYWAKALAKKLYPNHSENDSNKFSGIVETEAFKNFSVPFPIILTNSRWPNVRSTSETSQILEFTPFEFGSWDFFLNAFASTKYLGSALYNGKPVFYNTVNQSLCVVGYDDVSFVTASSSSLFNKVLIYIWRAVLSAEKKTSDAMKIILYTFGLGMSSEQSKNHPDYALLAPNPFYGYEQSDASKDLVESPHLFLVDGGEDKQNIPFYPFLQESRKVDVIFAVDSTSDSFNFPNGTCLKATFDRYTKSSRLFNTSTVAYKHSSNSSFFYHSVFPHIPTSDEIIANRLNLRPSFFGCELNNYPTRREAIFSTKSQNDYYMKSRQWLPPLIVYMPNSPHSFQSNTSTFKLSYNKTEVNKMINNGYNVATSGNSTTFSDCVACAFLKREFDRIERGLNLNYNTSNFKVPQKCQWCFKKYCYS